MSDLLYNAVAQLNDGSEVLLDLNKKGWADPEILNKTVGWMLVPKEQNGMPVVSVSIPEKGKPVYKSRVYGKGLPGSGLPSFRAYAIGYKKGRTTYWVWVLPNGVIEFTDEPRFAQLILNKMVGKE